MFKYMYNRYLKILLESGILDKYGHKNIFGIKISGFLDHYLQKKVAIIDFDENVFLYVFFFFVIYR